MFSNSHLLEKQADREMIAAATAEFYARGSTQHALQHGETAEPDDKRPSRQLVLDPVKHEQSTAHKRRPRKEIEINTATPRRLASIKIAQEKYAKQAKAEREKLAMKIAAFAGLGDTQQEIATAIGISRAHLQRIVKEFNINLKVQA
jgi:DNA-directed RNA polymerase specialized sigma subunit